MKEHIKKYYIFYLLYFIFIIGMAALLIHFPKTQLHLLLTSVHSPSLDLFFRYYTNVGGDFPFYVAAALLFYKYRAAFMILIPQLLTGIISNLLKNWFERPRPFTYFAQHMPEYHLRQVEGVTLWAHHSFPSGHTIAAFAFFLSLTFITHHKWAHVVYFLLAVLVGYSRIYLNQHFALDVLAGSFIGVFFTLLIKVYFENRPTLWANGSIRDFFKKRI